MHTRFFALFLLVCVIGLVEGRQYKRHILVIGAAGAGKSSLIQAIFDYKNDIAQMSFSPVTQTTTLYKGWVTHENDELEMFIYDTMGFGSSDTKSTIIKNITKTIEYDYSFDYVIVCIKMERENPAMFDGIYSLFFILNEYGLKSENIIVYLTHSEVYSDKIINEFKKRIEKAYASILKVKLETGCFVNLNDIKQHLKPYFEAALQKDRSNLLTKIKESVQPFCPIVFKLRVQECRTKCDNSSFFSNCAKEFPECAGIFQLVASNINL